MKGSKYFSVIKENKRYRIRVNPLHVLMKKTIFKSLEEKTEEKKVEEIINEELTEEFKLGGHEDFDYLLEHVYDYDDFKKQRVEDVKLCSLFVDLRNFTKRAMFIDDPGIETIEEIASLKQDAISTWIKLARYYQGHIHSITGDGIMVLIGGNQSQDIDEWTIGARTFLLALRILESEELLNDILKKMLREKGQEDYIKSDNLLDIKVGIEYSPNTLMNPQGVIVNLNGENMPVGEVKATAFEVDFSAKLLGFYKEAKEKIEGTTKKLGRVLMIGEKYKELMVFDKKQVEVKFLCNYEKRMFDKTKTHGVYYIDCKDLKDKIITIEDVASLCDVYDASEEARSSSINIVRGDKIQHGK